MVPSPRIAGWLKREHLATAAILRIAEKPPNFSAVSPTSHSGVQMTRIRIFAAAVLLPTLMVPPPTAFAQKPGGKANAQLDGYSKIASDAEKQW